MTDPMGSVDETSAGRLAAAWIDALNRRDLDAALELYAHDAVIASDGIGRLVPGSGGVLRGREALRDYWQAALEQFPDTRFTCTSVYAGHEAVLIHYRNERGLEIGEFLVLRDGLVIQAHGTRRIQPEPLPSHTSRGSETENARRDRPLRIHR
ncbi:nuclear transport factor 2 family protein [Streptomyces venetus]